jgi:hypothetical protein
LTATDLVVLRMTVEPSGSPTSVKAGDVCVRRRVPQVYGTDDRNYHIELLAEADATAPGSQELARPVARQPTGPLRAERLVEKRDERHVEQR